MEHRHKVWTLKEWKALNKSCLDLFYEACERMFNYYTESEKLLQIPSLALDGGDHRLGRTSSKHGKPGRVGQMEITKRFVKSIENRSQDL